MTTIVVTPMIPEVEPAASAMVPPVRNFTMARAFDSQNPETYCRTGIYYVAQDNQTGQYWNHEAQAFEVFDDANWLSYVKPLYYRGPGLWGAFAGADTFPAGSDLTFKFHSNTTNNGERGTESNGNRQIGTFAKKNWPAPLPNTIAVDHNTGGPDALRVLDPGNNPVANLEFTAFLTPDFNQHGEAAAAKGQSITDKDGRWKYPIRLPKATAITLYGKDAGFEPLRIDITTPTGVI